MNMYRAPSINIIKIKLLLAAVVALAMTFVPIDSGTRMVPSRLQHQSETMDWLGCHRSYVNPYMQTLLRLESKIFHGDAKLEN